MNTDKVTANASDEAVTGAAVSRLPGSEDTERKRAAAKKKRRRRKLIKLIIILAIVLAVLAAAGFGIYKLFFEPEPEPEDMTAMSYRGSFVNTVDGWGQVKASRSASVSIQARGELLELFVSDGDTVYEGQPLFIIDDASLRSDIAAVEEQISQLEEQRSSVLESADTVRKNRASIIEELDAIYSKLASLNVTVPFDGRLIDVEVKEDTYLSENTVIAQLVDDNSLVLKQYFSYTFEDEIAVGNRAEVSIPASMCVLNGTVTKIDKVRRITPEGAVLFAAEITIKNPGTLTAGMSAAAVLTDSNGVEITAYEDGSLEYARTKTITAPAKGRIIKYNLLDYSDYRAGETLLVISDDGYDEQIEDVKARTKSLDDQISGYEKQIESIDAQIAEKLEEIETLNGQFDAFNAVSPMSGTVMSVLAQTGSMVEAGSAVLTIADTTTMTVDIQLDERDVNNVEVGTPATLMQDTSTGSNMYFGTVTSVSLEGNYEYGYGYFPAVITIDGGDGLRSGSSMNYSITLSSKENCLLVPINAVKYTEQGMCVFVKDEGQGQPENAITLAEGTVPNGYWAVPVETGLSDDTQIEIVSGIEEGVTLFLSEGQTGMGEMYY